MKVEVIPGKVWVEINQFEIEGTPPAIKMSVSASHIFPDRKSEFRLSMKVLAWDALVGTASVGLFIPHGTNKQQQEALVVLPSDVVHTIESLRQRNKSDDVTFHVEISGLYIAWPTSPHQTSPLDMQPFKGGNSFRVSISEWKNVLGLAGHRIMLLDRTVVEKLEELRRKWGLWRVEDVLFKFIEAYEGVSPDIRQQFLVTMVESKTIRDRLTELANSARWREVRVVSLYLDNTGAELLIKMIKNGSHVKIITREDKKAHEDAVNMLKQMGAEVKAHKMAHARMVIFDDIAAIISSADLDSEGLNNQRQAGIYTTDKVVVRDAIVFFDKLWNEAKPYKS